MSALETLVGIAIALGIAGIVVPLLPGTLLVAGAILFWAVQTGGTDAWTASGVALGLLLVGAVVKYVVPGRRLNRAGVPTSTLWLGAGVGVVGFFVVPVLGLFLGFVLGIYLGERRRLGDEEAWPSTRSALRAVGLSILIELVAATLAAVTWGVGVVAT